MDLFARQRNIPFILGIVFVILIILSLGISQAYLASTIASISREMYRHPFRVNDAVNDIETDVYAIQQQLRDIILARSPRDIRLSTRKIDDIEQDSLKKFGIIEKWFLGDLRRARDTHRFFIEWRPIRDEVIRLSAKGRTAEAYDIARTSGTRQIERIMKDNDGRGGLNYIESFARSKAREFMNEAARKGDSLTLLVTAVLALALVLSFFVQLLFRRGMNTLRELEESRRHAAFLTDLLERSSQPFVVRNTDGSLQFFNEAYARLIGRTREELQSEDRSDIHTAPEWRERERSMLEELDRSGGPVRYEKEYLRKDGSRVPVEMFVHMVRGTGSLPAHSYAFITDITERKLALERIHRQNRELERMNEELTSTNEEFQSANEELVTSNELIMEREKDLRESRARLDLALRSAAMGVWRWDVIENRRHFDEQAFRLLGIDPAAFHGDREEFFDALHPDDREAVGEALSRTIEHDAAYEPDYRVIWPDGSVHYIASRGRLERDSSGRPVNLNGVLWDITDRKLADEALRASLAEKEVLIKEVHHRVKNNLANISGMLNLHEKKVADGAVRELFRELRSRIQSMALIHNVLYESKDMAMVDFGAYINRLSSMLMDSYGNPASIRLEISAERAALDINRAIPCGLILNELMINALKYAFPGERGGIIRIAFIKKEGVYRLLFSDNGAGMPDPDISGADTLGLSLVRMLCKQLIAEVRITVSEGTAFDISFLE